MLSVAFSTRNGSATLPSMLDALERIHVPDGGWKIIVADNGSTDATSEIIRARQARLPIDCVYEGKPGKNRALNRLLPLLEGELAVFTDDDVIPDENWLRRLAANAAERPDYTGFGGKVTPLWQVEPPDWVMRLVPLGPVFAITNPNLDAHEVRPDCLWGPNFALRTRLFREGCRFDETVGPDGSSTYRMGSETSLLRRLGKQGHRFWFCPDATVSHIVRPHQLRSDWILQRAFRLGRSLYHSEREDEFGQAAMLIGLPRWRIGKYLRSVMQYGLARIKGDFDGAFAARWEARLFEGHLFERGQSGSSSPLSRTAFRLLGAPDRGVDGRA